ncbi:UDP-N-acetylglucosamine 4,6-dehydratase/UDP-glucose 4-epimerase [Kordia periserrulae]|uniref:UDP-N-acetylglucosamine 4,6-dehydratase/UDP-glucose 4-epimerase n=1 Tax=Kordia periserrulae TaxID=701523 RepID=A0A2T6BSD1_9FLAO|nr:SDR family NAD(P)-dependent oxidoreductase [Kordia periserrulae]PTX58964.1 UDP-N-acetylglucosamine 4,6-dehydratase/UDP-glucose 4-epimerase [Kordia periserrulae]
MKKILITGGTGFLGRALARKFQADYHVIACGRNNYLNERVRKVVGCEVVPLDITNMDAVRETFSLVKPDIIIHAAATKYVHLAEQFPNECLDINIKGSQNIARAAIEHKVATVIGISTDKASVKNNSFYGLSKRVMEKLFVLMNNEASTKFACVRFGNIAWSTGSVFPIWQKMLKENNNLIETTGAHMRRFIFSLDDAVRLVENCLIHIDKTQGNILCPQMKTVLMQDALDCFIERFGGSYQKIPARAGESVDEVMIDPYEVPFTSSIKLNDESFYLIHKQRVENAIKESVSTDNQPSLEKEALLRLLTFESDAIF